MTSANTAIVQGIYQAIGAGNIPAALDAMSPDIVWNEADDFIYADRNPYVGPHAVVEGVFARLGGEWEGFSAHVEELLDAGEAVVALGRYSGTFKATGTAQDTQFVHVWRIKDGRAAGFQQYANTLHVARVTGTA
ncbi:MAG: nuclear transport factor 2 family protein [Croceibacterium sp.]